VTLVVGDYEILSVLESLEVRVEGLIGMRGIIGRRRVKVCEVGALQNSEEFG
jgi:hypothetical protein